MRIFIETTAGVMEERDGIRRWVPQWDYAKFRCAEHSDGEPGTWFLLNVLEREWPAEGRRFQLTEKLFSWDNWSGSGERM